MERTVGKTRSGKIFSWKVFSWKVQYEIGMNEVGKFGPKLESKTKVGKWLEKLGSLIELNLEIINKVGKLLMELERSMEV